jgi:hypothetical protein
MPYWRAALGNMADRQWVRMKDKRGGEMAMDLCLMVESRRKAAREPSELAYQKFCEK